MIDGCAHDFSSLVGTVLPAYFELLRVAMNTPMQMRDFGVKGIGPRTILKQYRLENDFSGCYVLIDKAPIYVGISQCIYSRLRQHVIGKTHSDATLAYSADFGPS